MQNTFYIEDTFYIENTSWVTTKIPLSKETNYRGKETYV
jgi:hypothetical protein